jgi:PAS domain S-box-containing protein
VTAETGLEALQSSPEFRGPVEPLEDHPHANDHFALVYESQQEQFATAVPFIRQGLERGERCLYITYENSREEVEAAMRDRGIDVDDALDSGQLSIHDEQETYLRNETFDADETIEFIDAAVEEATEEYEALRMTGEMSSVLQEDPECEELVKCEAKVNYLFDDVDGLALCQYNRNRFPAAVIRDVVSTHPLLVHDGRVSHNVYYTPPGEFFGPNKTEREVERLLGTLREQTDAKVDLHQRERFLREGYKITADAALDFEEKLHRLLDLARERMGLDAAGLTLLPEWDGPFRIEYALGYGDGDGDGVVTAADNVWTDPGDGCFCRQTIKSEEPVGMADVRGTDWEDDPIHREHGLSSYLGTRVTIGSRPYGTLWVGGTEPRDRAFTEPEKTFLELIGQWVSNELERREHTDAQRALYEVAADPDRGFDEKLDALFDLGRERFGLDIGGMVEVYPDEDRLEVEYVSEEVGEFGPGLEPPLSGTYCGAAYGADGPATVTDPVAEGYTDGFAYRELGFRAYLGTHIEVDGERDRLFFFTTTEPRDAGFSNAEETFLELIGQWVKHELERRQRERELERALDLLEKTERIADVGGWEIDVETRDVYWTDHVFDLLEVSADEEPPLEEALSMYHEGDEPVVADAVETALDSGEPFDVEVRICTPSDETRWLRLQGVPEVDDGEVVSLRGTAQDVTERRERERELERVERQFEAAFNNPSSFMGLLDPDGTVRRINQTALSFVGIDESAVHGEKFWETPFFAHSEELQEEVRAKIARAADGEYVRAEFSHESPNGETVFVDAMLEPVRDEDGEVAAIVPSGNDITERKEHAERLEQKTDRLESFASMLAHELRNPTMIGQIYSQQLPGGSDSDAVEYVTEAFDRIEAIIDVMLVLTRGQEAVGERAPVALADAARDAWDNVDAPDAELAAESDGVIEADETYVQHLFRNLLKNAVEHGSTSNRPMDDDAVEHGGRDVTVTVGTLSDDVSASDANDGSANAVGGFYVADDGVGIPADERDVIFDEGYTTAAESGGSGLGLAFVRKLTNVYGWDCTVTESEAGGARFEFRTASQ